MGRFFCLWSKCMKPKYVKSLNNKKEENWIDDLMEKQEHDLEEEEKILSHVPNRIKYQLLEEER